MKQTPTNTILANSARGAALLLGAVLGLGALTPAHAAQPCCSVVEIDRASATVTARVAASGQTFRFTVTDRALLGRLAAGQRFAMSPSLDALRPGQQFAASFASREGVLRPTYAQPCCSLKELVAKPPGAR